MIDASVVIGSASALGGVVLGSWLSGRIQRQTLDESRRQEARQARQQAYVDFLAAHRQFRRFLYTEPVSVHLVPHADGCGTTTPVVEGAAKHWEAVETGATGCHVTASVRTRQVSGDSKPSARAWTRSAPRADGAGETPAGRASSSGWHSNARLGDAIHLADTPPARHAV